MLRQRSLPSVLAFPVLSAIVSLAVSLILHSTSANAFDDNGREAVIGSFNLQPSRVQPDPAHTPGDVGTEYRTAPADDDVLNLYEDAMEDLAAGARASAQRLFERIIAQAPDSAVAARARRELAGLYAPEGGAPAEAAASTSMRPASVRGDQEPDWPAPSGVTRTPMPSATPTKSSAPGSAVSPEVEMQFILDAGDRVFFSAGTDDLGARARGVLAAQARWLRTHPDVDVSVVGHADDAPLSGEQQASLAQRRAESVRERLITEGIDERRIFVTSVGRDERVAECDRPECTAQNRRAVTQLSNRTGLRRPVGYVTDPR